MNWTVDNDNGLLIYRFSDYGGLVMAMTTRAFGGDLAYHTAETGEEIRHVTRCRHALSSALGMEGIAALHQTHSDIVRAVSADNAAEFMGLPLIEGDGLITDAPGFLLGVMTADCVPVFLIGPAASFVGAVHAGRAGADKGIAGKAVRMAAEVYGINPGSVTAVIGPHIRKCCYEIGSDMAGGYPERYITRYNGRTHLDLEAMIMEDLTASGLALKNIRSVPLCTRCATSPAFFSYRAGDRKCRMMSVIGFRRP